MDKLLNTLKELRDNIPWDNETKLRQRTDDLIACFEADAVPDGWNTYLAYVNGDDGIVCESAMLDIMISGAHNRGLVIALAHVAEMLITQDTPKEGDN